MRQKLFFMALVAGLGLAQAAEAGSASVYLGGGIMPLEIKGVSDIAVSDWQTFGTGPAEGRLRLPLAKAKVSGTVPAIDLGAQVELHPLLTGLLEIHLGLVSGNTNLTMVSGGLLYTPIRTGRFTLGLGPKVGYAMGTVSFGEAKVIAGKTAPVILPEGRIQDGAKLEAQITGVTVQGVVSAKYMFTDKLGLQLDGGYLYGAMGNFELKAGDITLKKDNPALVKDDGSTTQAGIDPKASMSGAIGTVSLVYAFQ